MYLLQSKKLLGHARTRALGELVSLSCTECGCRDLVWDRDSGEVVCQVCGLVVEESTVDAGPEWRSFTMKEFQKKSRVGLPPSFSIHDKGLSTMIGPVYRDGKGKRIPREEKLRMYRLRRWHIRSLLHRSKERNLAQAMIELERLTYRLNVPRVVKERAAIIYRKALRNGLVRGRSISSIAAASLYTAFRATRTPRTLEEIAAHSPIDKKEIARYYRILLRELELRMPVPKAQYRVPKIASKVELGEHTQQKAIEILGEADRLKISVGKDPMGLAGAALYLACVMNDERRTQKMIAEAVGVTEVTIRNRYTELKKELNLDTFKRARKWS